MSAADGCARAADGAFPWRGHRSMAEVMHAEGVPLPAAPAGPATPGGVATAAMRAWLLSGVDRPGGQLDVILPGGRRLLTSTIEACLAAGYAQRWYENVISPGLRNDIYRLTKSGWRLALGFGDER